MEPANSNNVEYWLQCLSNSKRHFEPHAPGQWPVDTTVQGILEGQVPDILVDEDMMSMLYAVPNERYNVWVPQFICWENHIQDLLLFFKG